MTAVRIHLVEMVFRHAINTKRAGSSHMILSRSLHDGAVLPASVLISVGTKQEADPTDHCQTDGAWPLLGAPLGASTVGTWTMAVTGSQAKRGCFVGSPLARATCRQAVCGPTHACTNPPPLPLRCALNSCQPRELSRQERV